MRVLMTVECASCGHKERCIMTDQVVSVGRYWRLTPDGAAICAGEECNDAAEQIGAKPQGQWLGED